MTGMEERKQFTMYESIYKSLQRIRKKQDRADAYDAICAYALYNQKPDLESLSEAGAIVFELIQPVLDTARKKAVGGMQSGKLPESNRRTAGSYRKDTGKMPGSQGEDVRKEKEKEIEKEIETESEREKEGSGEPLGNARARDERNAFSLFWGEYPNKTDREEAWKAWQALNPDEGLSRAIREGLEAWKRSGQWLDDDGRFIPTAVKWLQKRRWEAPPTPNKPDIPKGASGVFGQAELEAIQRVLREEI